MSFLNMFRRSVPKVGELEVGNQTDLRKRKYNYISECVISFDGNPVRRVKFEISAYSRRHAEEQIRKQMKIDIRRTYKNVK